MQSPPTCSPSRSCCVWLPQRRLPDATHPTGTEARGRGSWGRRLCCRVPPGGRSQQKLTQVAPPPREAREAGAGVGGVARDAVVDALAAIEAGAQGQAHGGCGHREGRAVSLAPGAPLGGGAARSAAAGSPLPRGQAARRAQLMGPTLRRSKATETRHERAHVGRCGSVPGFQTSCY